MNRIELEIEENTMTNGNAMASLPNNFNGSIKFNKNTLDGVEIGVFVRDKEKGLENLLLEFLKSDTPPEKIQEIITALKSLETKTEDTVYESLYLSRAKDYLDVGSTLINLAVVLVQYFGLSG